MMNSDTEVKPNKPFPIQLAFGLVLYHSNGNPNQDNLLTALYVSKVSLGIHASIAWSNQGRPLLQLSDQRSHSSAEGLRSTHLSPSDATNSWLQSYLILLQNYSTWSSQLFYYISPY